MYHYIYKTTNLITGFYYIGCHSSRSLENSYLGSGVHITRAIKKYGPDNFEKKILFLCNTRQEKFDLERDIITEELLQDPLCMNICPGGKGGTVSGKGASFYGRKHKPETIEKMREKSTGRRHTPESREKIKQNHHDVSGENNPMFGKVSAMAGRKRPEVAERNRLRRGIPRGPDSEETRRKKSEAHKGKPSPMLGKKHSPETKKRISEKGKEAVLNRVRGPNGAFVSRGI